MQCSMETNAWMGVESPENRIARQEELTALTGLKRTVVNRSEVLARTKQSSASPAPGAGTVFALRAIGLVLAARWLFSMSQMGYLASMRAMTSSPWACVTIVLLFLLLFLPGARARAERPLHPLPQWLRQALRLLALLSFLFAVWSVGFFTWTAGWKNAVHALAETNGWLLVAPALYGVVDLPAARALAHEYCGTPVCYRPLCYFHRYHHAHRRRLGRKPQARSVRCAGAIGEMA